MTDSSASATPATPLNIHSVATFIPNFDGTFPVQDFIQEVKDAAKLGSWPDNICIKVAKSKLSGTIADLVRNRHDINHATTFQEFSDKLTSALHTERPVSVRLQELMTCVQQPEESVDAYATRIRQKAKGLTEWDATDETKQLKNRTVAAAFVKGLKPNIRQLVLPSNPSDFEVAITLARSHELSASLMPTENFITPLSAASASTSQNLPDAALRDIQKRVASLELSTAQASSTRGRGYFPARGRGRARGRGQPYRQNFNPTNQMRFRQSRSWTGPPQYHDRHWSQDSRNSRFDSRHASYSQSPRRSCHCCSGENSRYRSQSRHDYDRYRDASPCHQRRSYRRESRSPGRDQRKRYSRSRSPSVSPSRNRHPSPNGYRSRR